MLLSEPEHFEVSSLAMASQPNTPGTCTSLADLVHQLIGFEGRPEQFLRKLLLLQCQVASASGGAILRIIDGSRAEVIAIVPPLPEGATVPVWVAQSAEHAAKAVSGKETLIQSLRSPDQLYGQDPRNHLVLIPLRSAANVRGVAAFMLEAANTDQVAAKTERLELTASLLSLYEMRVTLQQRQVDLCRLRMVLETMSAANDHDRCMSASIAFCNELASRWQCERVTLGFLRGRYVHMHAMSGTDKVNRKMRLVQDIEAAMEECLDQDVEVIYPGDGATYISRAARELAQRHGPTIVCSLPLRRKGQAIAVVTTERSPEMPPSRDEVESLRLVCDLCTPHLATLFDQDRWIGAKCADSMRRGLATLVGPKHTWIKLLAILICAAVSFLMFAKGEYRAEAPFIVEAQEQQVVPAPYDGHLETVGVEIGDMVQSQGTVLATLDTSELRLRLAAARAEAAAYLKQKAVALDEGNTAEAQMAQAQADKLRAEIDLLEYKMQKASVMSRMDGVVVVGDLKRQIGAPVKTGDVLFEVAPLEALRAVLAVPEDQIIDVKVGQQGELATASYPGHRVGFTVERIDPVAEVVDEQNVFRVRVRLFDIPTWMRPGMEGLGKIDLGRRSYGWIWSREVVNWIRMKLWL